MRAELPQDLDAERAVLGALLDDAAQWPAIAALIDRDDFSLETHKRIFDAMASVREVGGRIEGMSVMMRLRERGQMEGISVSYLSELQSPMVSAVGGEHYARRVREYSIRRRTILACDRLMKELQSGAESVEALAQAEKVLRDLSADSAKDRRLRTAGELVMERGGIEPFLAIQSESGLPTRWPGVNRLMSLRPEQLWIIAARPSVGKTSAATDIAESVAAGGHGVAFFSLEMSADDLIVRMACMREAIDWMDYRRGHLSREDGHKLRRSIAEVAGMPIYFDDTAACTVPAIHAALTRLIASAQVDLVVIDYLQLIQPTGKYGSRNEAVSAISRELKLASKEFKVPFVVLSQLTRENERQGRRPVLSDLRDSGSIEQDADGVVFIHRPDQQFTDVRPSEFIVAKQRNGPVGMVDMVFLAKYTRFQESTSDREAAA